MEIKKANIIGAGVMGMGISQALAQSGFEVTITDLNEDILKASLAKTHKRIQSRVERGKISANEAKEVLTRIRTTTKIQDIADVGLVIEAVEENMKT